MRIFGEHIEDLLSNFPGSRPAAFWGAFLPPRRREELARAAFESVATGLWDAAVARPAVGRELHYFAAKCAAEAAVTTGRPPMFVFSWLNAD